MARALWNGVVIAESDRTVVVEGNHYFPVDSVQPEVLVPSGTHTTCPWKGVASYYTLEVGGSATPTRPGTTRNRKRRPPRSRVASRSGAV